MKPTLPALLLCLSGQFALADAPRVAVDILPVHSLVARVMQGAGTPDLIMSPGASPHGYAMKPSQAAALSNADVVVWVGDVLTPWLHKPLQNLATQAEVLELLALEDTTVLPFREGALFEADGHDHDHADDHSDDHDDDHGSIDPHAWLDPVNAGIWLDEIAKNLAVQDPENADLYFKNAMEGQAEIATVQSQISDLISPFKGTRFMVFHDAYHYFEARFGIEAVGALSPGDATAPSPARLARLREAIERQQISCVFSEPQFNAKLIEAVVEGTDTKIEVLDPMGVTLAQGPELYAGLLLQMATAMSGCSK